METTSCWLSWFLLTLLWQLWWHTRVWILFVCQLWWPTWLWILCQLWWFALLWWHICDCWWSIFTHWIQSVSFLSSWVDGPIRFVLDVFCAGCCSLSFSSHSSFFSSDFSFFGFLLSTPVNDPSLLRKCVIWNTLGGNRALACGCSHGESYINTDGRLTRSFLFWPPKLVLMQLITRIHC